MARLAGRVAPGGVAGVGDNLAMVGGTYGNSAVLWRSTDASEWTVAEPAPVFDRDADVRDLAVINGAVVAVGYDASIDQAAFWIAEDGRTWRRTPPDETSFALTLGPRLPG